MPAGICNREFRSFVLKDRRRRRRGEAEKKRRIGSYMAINRCVKPYTSTPLGSACYPDDCVYVPPSSRVAGCPPVQSIWARGPAFSFYPFFLKILIGGMKFLSLEHAVVLRHADSPPFFVCVSCVISMAKPPQPPLSMPAVLWTVWASHGVDKTPQSRFQYFKILLLKLKPRLSHHNEVRTPQRWCLMKSKQWLKLLNWFLHYVLYAIFCHLILITTSISWMFARRCNLDVMSLACEIF